MTDYQICTLREVPIILAFDDYYTREELLEFRRSNRLLACWGGGVFKGYCVATKTKTRRILHRVKCENFDYVFHIINHYVEKLDKNRPTVQVLVDENDFEFCSFLRELDFRIVEKMGRLFKFMYTIEPKLYFRAERNLHV